MLDRRTLLRLGGAGLAFTPALSACDGPGLDQLAAGPLARVADVISGDSLTLDGGQGVRLAGVEAPKGHEQYGPEARQALTELVAGKTVQLLYGGARQDPYGRALAHLRLKDGGAWVQNGLLDQGAARVRTWADNRALARPMLDAEARARAAKKGLWTLLAYQVRLPEEAAVDPFGFQIVEGRVTTVDRGGFGLAIDLERWLRGEAPAPADGPFAAAGLTPAALKGRLVRLRGVLKPDRGEARMALDHPEQVELLKA